MSAMMKYQIPPNEFFDKIHKTNFRDTEAHAEGLWMMEMGHTPFCPLGESDFGGIVTSYGLHPGANYLSPNLNHSEDADVIHHSLLGINTNVPIEIAASYRSGGPTSRKVSSQKRRQERSSGEDPSVLAT